MKNGNQAEENTGKATAFEIETICAKCGNHLGITELYIPISAIGNQEEYRPKIRIHSCQDCLKKTFKRGETKGYKAGKKQTLQRNNMKIKDERINKRFNSDAN